MAVSFRVAPKIQTPAGSSLLVSTSPPGVRVRRRRDRATGESYRIAHHLFTEDGERKLMVAHLRYDDTIVRRDGAWLFAERNPYVDWTETPFCHP